MLLVLVTRFFLFSELHSFVKFKLQARCFADLTIRSGPKSAFEKQWTTLKEYLSRHLKMLDCLKLNLWVDLFFWRSVNFQL